MAGTRVMETGPRQSSHNRTVDLIFNQRQLQFLNLFFYSLCLCSLFPFTNSPLISAT